MSNYFPKPPFLAYGRAPNLQDYLVKSRLKRDGELEITHEVEEDCYLDALIKELYFELKTPTP